MSTIDEDSFYLIANQSRINKKMAYVSEDINEELYFLLHKRFKKYSFDEDIFKILLVDIEKKLNEYTIEKTVETIVNNLIETLIDAENE